MWNDNNICVNYGLRYVAIATIHDQPMTQNDFVKKKPAGSGKSSLVVNFNRGRAASVERVANRRAIGLLR